MKSCNCEHWEVCPVCKPGWFDSEGNRLPPEPTPLQKANGRIEELEQQLTSARAEVAELNNNVTICVVHMGELRQQLADSQKREAMLRDALLHLWNERTPDSLDEAGEALAATEPKP